MNRKVKGEWVCLLLIYFCGTLNWTLETINKYFLTKGGDHKKMEIFHDFCQDLKLYF